MSGPGTLAGGFVNNCTVRATNGTLNVTPAWVNNGFVNVHTSGTVAGGNLTNAAALLGRVTQLGPTYGRASSIQRGRLVKAGFSIEF